MKKLFSCVLILACALSVLAQESPNVSTADTTNQTVHNREIFERVSATLRGSHDVDYRFEDVPMNELVVRVGLQFLGTQYLWASLESVPEKLNVFLDKTDCILFVEMSTCFALTLKGKRIVQRDYATSSASLVDAEPSYELLVHNIRNMRYRRGEVTTYSSRVHYTSEWLIQNARNGLMREFTSELGEEFTQTFSYMTDHTQVYYQLKDNPEETARIRKVEEWLDAQGPYFYISQERLRNPEVMKQIHSGDIITFISPRKGLDLAHVAIAYEKDGEMHFIHASYGAKKVIIEPKTLAEYATNGLRITRLNPLTQTLQVKPGERIEAALEQAREAYRLHGITTTIDIQPGTYYEELTIDVPGLCLRNASQNPSIEMRDGGVHTAPEAVRISWYCGHGYQYRSMGDKFNFGGSRMRRWNASVLVTAPGFRAENIIFENSFNMYVSEAEVADQQVDVSRAELLCGANMQQVWSATERPKRIMPERPLQVGNTDVQQRFYRERASAISFTSEATNCVLKNCRVVGRQDTFYGDHGASVLVEGGALCGAVDYIFGGLTLEVRNADLVSLTNNEKGDKCYISAARGANRERILASGISQESIDSIPSNEFTPKGMLFVNCRVRFATPDEIVDPGHEPVYLGRPWRWWGETIFVGTKAEEGVLVEPEKRFNLGLTKGHPAPWSFEE